MNELLKECLIVLRSNSPSTLCGLGTCCLGYYYHQLGVQIDQVVVSPPSDGRDEHLHILTQRQQVVLYGICVLCPMTFILRIPSLHRWLFQPNWGYTDHKVLGSTILDLAERYYGSWFNKRDC
jgi:hypothetical protein